MGINRREFLRYAMSVAALPLFPNDSILMGLGMPCTEKNIHLYNIHTGERLNTVYWAYGQYLPEALGQINHIMRDHRTGQLEAIDPRLMDLLHSLTQRLDSSDPFYIISGYRSPLTNSMLNKQSSGVAKNSLHMSGKAVDIRIPGVDLSDLRDSALSLRMGGVGYYPQSYFVHVDTGRVHHWNGL